MPPAKGVDRAITAVFLLSCLEGLCGGSAYVNTFFHVGHEGGHAEDNSGDGTSEEEVKEKMEKEFRIGATGAADSCGKCLVMYVTTAADSQPGILLASLISMPVELALCNAQVKAGRSMCREL